MKKIILLSLILSITYLVNAQKNVIKMGLPNFLYGDINVGYERLLSSKNSVSLIVGYWNPEIGVSGINNILKQEDGIWIKEFQSGKNIALDYRIYPAEKALSGMYFGPYLRYWDLSLVMGDEVEPNLFDVETQLKGIGLGFQFGIQWIIAKRISIDWYILGLGVERFLPDANYVITPYQSGFDYASIEDNVMGIFDNAPTFIKNKAKSVVNADNLNITVPIFAPSLRSGFTVGFAF